MRWRWSWLSAVWLIFFREGVVGVLKSAHDGGVDADVESFETVEIAGGI